MLEQMRKSSQSLLIYLLFSVLIVVFIISFGPQSRGTTCDAALGGNDHYAAKVAGDIVSTNDFRYGFLIMGGAQAPSQIAKQRRNASLLFLLPVVFAVLHLTYGVGSLWGCAKLLKRRGVKNLFVVTWNQIIAVKGHPVS